MSPLARVLRAPAIFIAFLALVLPASAEPDFTREIEQFRAFAERQLEVDELPGFTIGFVLGDYTWVEGFGYADIENEKPAIPESAYRLASVTKPMTAIGILTLMEQGKLDLEDEVQEYVPYFPRKEYPVTIGLLLGHLGGISHYQNYAVEGVFTDHKDTREAIAVFEDFDLVAEPGTRYQYSSYGYNLLGAVIEGASGQSYADFMRENLWAPLGMTSTRMDDPDADIPNRVRGYAIGDDGEIEPARFVNISSRFAAGGTRSTVPDLLRFARGLMDGRILSADTRDLMWTSMVTRDGEMTGYGMGWSIRPVNGRFRVAHSGGQPETSTYFAYFPEDDLAIAIGCNMSQANYFPLVDHLYRLVVDEGWNQRIYLASAEDGACFAPARAAFNWGVMQWDRYGAPVTTDDATLDEAFTFFNENSERTLAGGAALSDPDLDINSPPASNPMIILGSYMAARLADAGGSDFGAQVHGDGVARFFARYIDLARSEGAPPTRRFTPAFEARAETWARDWDVVWTEETRLLAVTHRDDLGQLAAELQDTFANLSIYPEYGESLVEIGRARFRRRDVEGAMEAVDCAASVYPLAGTPDVLAGVCRFVLGDTEAGRACLVRAHERDPRGSAGPAGLNGTAYELKGYGLTAVGLQVLEIALEFHPEVANLYDSAGEFHLALGDRDQAIALYEEAIALDPEFENPRRMLAEIRGEPAGVGAP